MTTRCVRNRLPSLNPSIADDWDESFTCHVIRNRACLSESCIRCFSRNLKSAFGVSCDAICHACRFCLVQQLLDASDCTNLIGLRVDASDQVVCGLIASSPFD